MEATAVWQLQSLVRPCGENSCKKIAHYEKFFTHALHTTAIASAIGARALVGLIGRWGPVALDGQAGLTRPQCSARVTSGATRRRLLQHRGPSSTGGVNRRAWRRPQPKTGSAPRRRPRPRPRPSPRPRLLASPTRAARPEWARSGGLHLRQPSSDASCGRGARGAVVLVRPLPGRRHSVEEDVHLRRRVCDRNAGRTC